MLWMILLAFVGLCTLFACVTTAFQAWNEHTQSQWPEVTAQVDKCTLPHTSTRQRNRQYIRCRLLYTVGTDKHTATVFSASRPSPEVPQSPPNQLAPLQAWVDQHSPGTDIVVHYNPANPTKIALVTTDMPTAGPRTPNNLKVVKVCTTIFLVLAALALNTKPNSPTQPA
jgi:hypothetical protein